jgi:outer membrane biosynthesis protein TonB
VATLEQSHHLRSDDAVKQWRYEPKLLNGEPVQVDTTISVVFTLGKK